MGRRGAVRARVRGARRGPAARARHAARVRAAGLPARVRARDGARVCQRAAASLRRDAAWVTDARPPPRARPARRRRRRHRPRILSALQLAARAAARPGRRRLVRRPHDGVRGRPGARRVEGAAALHPARTGHRALPVWLVLGRPGLRRPRHRRRLPGPRPARLVIHELPLERATVHGHFSRELPPVLTVDSGDSVRFRSLNAGWRWEADREVEYHRPGPLDEGHALCGPIEVRRAQAGSTLAVRVDEVVPGGWGVTFGGGAPFGWTLKGEAWRSERGHAVVSAPFLGVIGMPPRERGVHSTIPPRRWGGNIDCKELVAGSTLFLPIP